MLSTIAASLITVAGVVPARVGDGSDGRARRRAGRDARRRRPRRALADDFLDDPEREAVDAALDRVEAVAGRARVSAG